MRRIAVITGSRADYGLMEPVLRGIAADPSLDLHLLVTGMHLRPEFASGLEQVREQRLGILHEVRMLDDGDSGATMARSIGRGIEGMVTAFEEIGPEIVLLQGDRGEMLAAAIAAVHSNLPLVHMSGGDVSGSVDDSVRNAISKLAHFHLTNCAESTVRLCGMGEARDRILTVGEPGLDQLLLMDPLARKTLETDLGLPEGDPFVIATLHPVTDEVEEAPKQMTAMLEALQEVGLPSVVTYPNSDAGGGAMREVLESWRGRAFLRIVPNLGSRRYLSLIRYASAVIGNSSSGLYDTPSLKVPAVNIGTRQTGRMRAANVVDCGNDRGEIVRAIRHVTADPEFLASLAQCRNPFGDGQAARRTVAVLKHLRLGSRLVAKWLPGNEPLLAEAVDEL